MQVIKDYALKKNIDVPVKKIKKKGQPTLEPMIKFRTSAICIHPHTNQLFLLSASDHLLFVFGSTGELEHIEKLNQQTFNKPEGIAFLENGDMLISNEGQDGKPTVLKFKTSRP
jgi:uncharacterized protein YjiK